MNKLQKFYSFILFSYREVCMRVRAYAVFLTHCSLHIVLPWIRFFVLSVEEHLHSVKKNIFLTLILKKMQVVCVNDWISQNMQNDCHYCKWLVFGTNILLLILILGLLIYIRIIYWPPSVSDQGSSRYICSQGHHSCLSWLLNFVDHDAE